ncbi:hypothetical protein [Methylobacterium sp. Leaf117]|uniref:hypothetical protein n=1 Tax=Methylobacterium sp. Leaf117 TaxID=1736260 RepID=UPI0012E2EED0|nr:hypothetical protein [Methylobacterium sp. Leaf117]
MSQDVEHLLREWAILQGQDPDPVIKDFKHGGPLAKLVRSVLSAAPEPKRGRRADVKENWRRFVLVVMAKRRLSSGTDTGAPDEFHLAAQLDQRDDWEGDPGLKRPEMYRATYRRMSHHGWQDEHVPKGLGAFYAPPPDLTDK